MKEKQTSQKQRLGDELESLDRFPELDALFNEFDTAAFRAQTARVRFKQVNRALLHLIQKTEGPAFLLSAVVEFMERVSKAHLLSSPYRFKDFEFWLNHSSRLDKKEKALICAKIMGKYLPREDYQCYFPIGMDRTYSGSHFVAAHLSPDIDTTVASFWGWVDAFAARVSEGLHIWFLPGGPPESYFTNFFEQLFGSQSFQFLSKETGRLVLTAQDLLSKNGMVKKPAHTLVSHLDHSEGRAIILVDEEGHYKGDWRSTDLEEVRQVIAIFAACLRWFENDLYVKLVGFFSKENLVAAELPPLIDLLFGVSFGECPPLNDFHERQRKQLGSYLKDVLGVQRGLHGTFAELAEVLQKHGHPEFIHLQEQLRALTFSPIFAPNGHLKEDRPALFKQLEEVIKSVNHAIRPIREYAERLDMMVAIKKEVLHQPINPIPLDMDVDLMREKIGSHSHLTVVVSTGGDEKYVPVGIVEAQTLRRAILGTVTLRDFSNEEETLMSPYLQIISVVDHHKIALKTTQPPLLLVGDVQSTNVLLAEKAFELNDRYSLGGLTPKQIKAQVEGGLAAPTAQEFRLYQKRMKRFAALHQESPYFIHPKRESAEYLFFLYAILDDTDLLAKAGHRDLHCVAELLNRLKSLSSGKDYEVVHFDDIPQDEAFVAKATLRLLKNDDLYRIYKRLYAYQEEGVAQKIADATSGGNPHFFADTKEQSGCARIGQAKIFSSSHVDFQKQAHSLRARWLELSQTAHRLAPQVDLHLFMISTISGADEVYKGLKAPQGYQDEIWLWIPDTSNSYGHLATFLSLFGQSKEVLTSQMSVELCGPKGKELEALFEEFFGFIPRTVGKETFGNERLAILRFNPGAINSRKASITPYLPKH